MEENTDQPPLSHEGLHSEVTADVYREVYQRLFAITLYAHSAHEALQENDTSAAIASLVLMIDHLKEFMRELRHLYSHREK
jgi:hypothetical protein